jgi:hypothetical protein
MFLGTKRGGKDREIIFQPYRRTFAEFFKRYDGEDLNNKNLLIFRVGGFGDIMFSQPVVKYLKRKYPSVVITYCTLPLYKPLLISWPEKLVDYMGDIPFEKGLLEKTNYHINFSGVPDNCDEGEG